MTGSELRDYRLSRRLPQSGLAGDLGVATNTIARWERGERPIPASIARTITMRQDRAAIISSLQARVREQQAEIAALKKRLHDARRPRRSKWDRWANWLREDGAETSVGAGNSATAIYHRLVAKYHPDRHPEQAEVMRDINELYQALRRP